MVQLSHKRLTIWWTLVAIGALPIAGLIFSWVLWLQYPHINVTIFNESSTPIHDLRVQFLYGERTAKQLNAGGVALTDIQSGGHAGIYFAYRSSARILTKADPIYYESRNRGYLRIHVKNEGVNVTNGIYCGDEIPILGILRVPLAGEMMIK